MTLESSIMIKNTTDQFIEKARNIHGNKFNYSLVEYKGCKSKIHIICKNNHVFEQSPNDHLNGHGCKKCAGWGEMKFNFKEFIDRAISIHGDLYDYSKYEYITHSTKSTIICKKHGVFLISPKEHLIEARGCSKCGYEKSTKKRTHTLENFVKKGNEVHNNKYLYDNVKYVNQHSKVKIICPTHGEFEQAPKDHLHLKQGCPSCKSSKGEITVEKYLRDNNIFFIRQYKFDNCRDKRPLPFDFYLPEYNSVIEYQGIQHYNDIEFFKKKDKGLEDRKRRDKIKKEFCLLNNISYINISYKEFNNIEHIISTKLKNNL